MAGTAGKTTTIKMGDSSPATTTVAELKTITGPTLQADQLDVTTFSSSGNYREFVGGLLSSGTISFTGNATSANHTALRAELGNADKYWRITFPCDSNIIADFQGPLTALDISTSHDGINEISGTITINGAVSWS